MPIDEVERHPYLSYFIDLYDGEENVPWDKFTRMIIGSFPVYELTDTIFPKFQNRASNPANWLNFFYGDETNQFWERLCATLEYDNLRDMGHADRVPAAISMLDKEGIILTDAILQTNRYSGKKRASPFSQDDHALMNNNAKPDVTQHLLLNTSLVKWVLKAKNLSALFFTDQKSTWGKNPGGWFHQILQDEGIGIDVRYESLNHLAYTIYDLERTYKRDINLFFLPSPSSYRWISLIGLQHPMFLKYLYAVDRRFALSVAKNLFTNGKAEMEKLKVHRDAFIAAWWRAFLVEKAEKFDGHVDVKPHRKLKEKV